MDTSTKYTPVHYTFDIVSLVNQKPRQKQKESILRAWWQEILALLVAIGTMVAIVKLLVFYDGKELPNWKGNMSLNAVASFLIVLQRGMLMIVIVESKIYSPGDLVFLLTILQLSVTLNGRGSDTDDR
jgi:hypothetical protein